MTTKKPRMMNFKQLKKLGRARLQALAKTENVEATGKTQDIINRLLEKWDSPTMGAASVQPGSVKEEPADEELGLFARQSGSLKRKHSSEAQQHPDDKGKKRRIKAEPKEPNNFGSDHESPLAAIIARPTVVCLTSKVDGWRQNVAAEQLGEPSNPDKAPFDIPVDALGCPFGRMRRAYETLQYTTRVGNDYQRVHSEITELKYLIKETEETTRYYQEKLSLAREKRLWLENEVLTVNKERGIFGVGGEPDEYSEEEHSSQFIETEEEDEVQGDVDVPAEGASELYTSGEVPTVVPLQVARPVRRRYGAPAIASTERRVWDYLDELDANRR